MESSWSAGASVRATTCRTSLSTPTLACPKPPRSATASRPSTFPGRPRTPDRASGAWRRLFDRVMGARRNASVGLRSCPGSCPASATHRGSWSRVCHMVGAALGSWSLVPHRGPWLRCWDVRPAMQTPTGRETPHFTHPCRLKPRSCRARTAGRPQLHTLGGSQRPGPATRRRAGLHPQAFRPVWSSRLPPGDRRSRGRQRERRRLAARLGAAGPRGRGQPRRSSRRRGPTRPGTRGRER